MKKTLVKLLAAVAVLAVCFHLAACSSPEEDKPIVIGTAAPDIVDGSQTVTKAEIDDTENTLENTSEETLEIIPETEPENTDTQKPETDIITETQTAASEETPETQQIETPTPTGNTGEDIAALAEAQIGKMFFYGGSTPEQGFDNPGLVYYVLNQNGVTCPRRTAEIAEMENQITYDQLQKGDVVVCQMEDGSKFVAVYIGDNKAVISTDENEPIKSVDISSAWYQKAFLYGIHAAN